jgi:hypothetical protein
MADDEVHGGSLHNLRIALLRGRTQFRLL